MFAHCLCHRISCMTQLTSKLCRSAHLASSTAERRLARRRRDETIVPSLLYASVVTKADVIFCHLQCCIHDFDDNLWTQPVYRAVPTACMRQLSVLALEDLLVNVDPPTVVSVVARLAPTFETLKVGVPDFFCRRTRFDSE